MRSHKSLSRALAAVAGSMDLSTGIALVVTPAQVLEWMRAPAIAGEALVFLRFVGAFVAAVGAAYLWALRGNRSDRLRTTFELTVLFRGAAGTFTAWAILAGQLPGAWWCVSATDLGLVALQLVLLPGLPRDE